MAKITFILLCISFSSLLAVSSADTEGDVLHLDANADRLGKEIKADKKITEQGGVDTRTYGHGNHGGHYGHGHDHYEHEYEYGTSSSDNYQHHHNHGHHNPHHHHGGYYS